MRIQYNCRTRLSLAMVALRGWNQMFLRDQRGRADLRQYAVFFFLA
jgi:hypothetical protein